MVLKKFLNNGPKGSKMMVLKSSLMMEPKRFHSDGTKNVS